MAGQRCAAPRCGRFVQRGTAWCSRHDPAAAWREADTEQGNPRADAARALALEFRRRLERGDYRQLLGDDLNTVIKQAAEEHGLTDEIGILRVVLAKLLLAEEDVATLATNVARVAGVAVQAARARRLLEGEASDGIQEAVTQILLELSAEP